MNDHTAIGPVEVVRFLVELATLVAVGAWGITNPVEPLGSLLTAGGFVLGVAILWGLLAAPKAPWRLAPPARWGFEILVFGGGILALVDLGRVVAAIVLTAAATFAILGTAVAEKT
ncbi:MAG: YrdB family protein [Salinirussus sp.]